MPDAVARLGKRDPWARHLAHETQLRWTHSVERSQKTNAFGDAQLSLDARTDSLMEQALERQARATEQQFLYASEERPEPMILGCRPGAKTTYSIACDPLDGSSVLSSNFAVGALAGVWQGGSLLGVSPRSMAAAVAAVFGSRTTFFLALKSTPGVHEFVLEKSQTASYLCTHTLSKGTSEFEKAWLAMRDLP